MGTITKNTGMGTGTKVLIGCGIFLLLAVICFVVLTAMGVAGVNQVASEIENTIAESERREQELFDNPLSVNEVAVVEDIEWEVVSARKLGSNIPSRYEFGDPCIANSGEFLEVKISVTNNKPESESISDLSLYDSENREFSTSSDAGLCIEDDILIFETINPGIKNTFTAVYEVPTDASGFRIKVGDLNPFIDGDHQYILLGF